MNPVVLLEIQSLFPDVLEMFVKLKLSVFVSVMGPESPGPRQNPHLLPPTPVSSPAYSMSVIVIVLTTLAAAVFLGIVVLTCRRRRKQWRSRKR